MTQAKEICLPTPLSVQVFGRPEDWEWIEPDNADQNEQPKPEPSFSATPEEQRLSA